MDFRSLSVLLWAWFSDYSWLIHQQSYAYFQQHTHTMHPHTTVCLLHALSTHWHTSHVRLPSLSVCLCNVQVLGRMLSLSRRTLIILLQLEFFIFILICPEEATRYGDTLALQLAIHSEEPSILIRHLRNRTVNVLAREPPVTRRTRARNTFTLQTSRSRLIASWHPTHWSSLPKTNPYILMTASMQVVGFQVIRKPIRICKDLHTFKFLL